MYASFSVTVFLCHHLAQPTSSNVGTDPSAPRQKKPLPGSLSIIVPDVCIPYLGFAGHWHATKMSAETKAAELSP
jgi:hypothetical protein